ncbi:universal stress protein [Maribacter sp. CXY002]|uniref:universal stress protein n=1 Tax=Maribacter luteocoastalis TaxID=3407671 RepID=UPI003B67DA14
MLHILLPTDFSETSYNAITYTMKLYNKVECTFYLLNTFTPAIYHADYMLVNPEQFSIYEAYKNDSETNLKALKEKLEYELPNYKHELVIHSVFNILIDEVKDFVNNYKIDFIAMGTKGATGAKEIFLGTHAVHIIRKSKVPVLAIPPNYNFKPPEKILFPTDYEVAYEKSSMQVLLDIANDHGSSIDVLHVSYGYDLSEKQQKNKRLLDNVMVDIPHLFHMYPNQEVIQAITNFQEKNDTQLLVMIQNKHTFIERIFIEPIIKKIGYHITTPFLVMPDID